MNLAEPRLNDTRQNDLVGLAVGQGFHSLSRMYFGKLR